MDVFSPHVHRFTFRITDVFFQCVLFGPQPLARSTLTFHGCTCPVQTPFLDPRVFSVSSKMVTIRKPRSLQFCGRITWFIVLDCTLLFCSFFRRNGIWGFCTRKCYVVANSPKIRPSTLVNSCSYTHALMMLWLGSKPSGTTFISVIDTQFVEQAV